MELSHKILKQKAVRITPMRQLLLEYFLQNNGTFGLIELESVFPKSDRITMYRTLKTFEEKGILHSIHNGTSEVKYALCDEHCTPMHHVDQHPHFHCEKCKQVTCIDSLVIPKMELPNDYIQKEITIMIKGICPDCQE
ncbi:MAG: transcriptional repressor [Flavobacteriales bacterium]|nr:transcriptional repressor [Flavobacteriales bacterium]